MSGLSVKVHVVPIGGLDGVFTNHVYGNTSVEDTQRLEQPGLGGLKSGSGGP